MFCLLSHYTRQHKYIPFVGKTIGGISNFVPKRIFFVLI